MALASKAQPNTGSCGTQNQGMSCHWCSSCAGTRSSSTLANMPASSPSSGANRRSTVLTQTLHATMVAKVSRPTSKLAPEAGVPSVPWPKISRKPRCPNPRPMSITATPDTSTVNTLRSRMIRKLNATCDRPITQTMPNTVASVAPGRLLTRYMAGSTAPVACNG